MWQQGLIPIPHRNCLSSSLQCINQQLQWWAIKPFLVLRGHWRYKQDHGWWKSPKIPLIFAYCFTQVPEEKKTTLHPLKKLMALSNCGNRSNLMKNTLANILIQYLIFQSQPFEATDRPWVQRGRRRTWSLVCRGGRLASFYRLMHCLPGKEERAGGDEPRVR